MVRVTEDREQKLVDVIITGFASADEVARAANEVKATMKHYGPEQALLLIDLLGFTPKSNDVLPVLRGLGRDVISFFRKSALVQEFSMNFQGGRRAIEPPPGYKLPAYQTREDAMRYLMAEES